MPTTCFQILSNSDSKLVTELNFATVFPAHLPIFFFYMNRDRKDQKQSARKSFPPFPLVLLTLPPHHLLKSTSLSLVGSSCDAPNSCRVPALLLMWLSMEELNHTTNTKACNTERLKKIKEKMNL